MSIRRILVSSSLIVLALSSAALACEMCNDSDWSYEGTKGPAHWATLKPDFKACGEGPLQSPVNISTFAKGDLPDIAFSYQDIPLSLSNTGRMLKVAVPAGSKAGIGGHDYALEHISFHTPSEHYMDGSPYPMEVHFVHKDAKGAVDVIAVMMKIGAANETIEKLWSHIPAAPGQDIPVQSPAEGMTFSPYDLLPAGPEYYSYQGSLTTPPCTEGVSWQVMQQPIEISEAQLTKFQQLFAHNARPLQGLNGRVVKGD
jgi:carbonic anhydrase